MDVQQEFFSEKPPVAECQSAEQAVRDPHAMDRLTRRIGKDKYVRLGLAFKQRCEDSHLKDLVATEMDDQRGIVINGRRLVNFGSDSFLGLDRDPRVQQTIARHLEPWGTHNGSSRSFASVALAEQAERRLAEWLGVPETLIFPSVTLANAGLIPAITDRQTLLVVDRHSHESIWQAAKISQADGANLQELKTPRGDALEKILRRHRYQSCVIAVDGVYSMTGAITPLAELDEVARRYNALLYVDDAHATGLIGPQGRGAAYHRLGRIDHLMLVGSLSKAFSCLGAFVTCNPDLKLMLKMKASSYMFGGPVPPAYLAAINTVCDIICSDEYEDLVGHLRFLIQRLVEGSHALGLNVLGGESAIVSIRVGDIEKTFAAGRYLFDQGFYVQSSVFPAVSINGGLLRIQVNANHTVEQLDGLLEALATMKAKFQIRG